MEILHLIPDCMESTKGSCSNHYVRKTFIKVNMEPLFKIIAQGPNLSKDGPESDIEMETSSLPVPSSLL